MRVLHTSDWHLGKTLQGRERLPEQEAFIDEICCIAADERIDLIMIAGDIFDTYNPPSRAEQLFCDALDRLADGGKRGVVAIAGNHDSPDRICAVRPLALRQGIFIFGSPASGPGWMEIAVPGCGHSAVILTLPYPSEARLNELLSSELDEDIQQRAYSQKVKEIFGGNASYCRPDTVNLLLSHLFIAGGKVTDSERPVQLGGACTVYPDALPGVVQYWAFGHLHRPQAVGGAGIPAYYSGSPLAYSFSEANQTKSVHIIDVQPGSAADVKNLWLHSGKPLVKWQAKGGINEALKQCEENRNRDLWIELEVYLTENMSMDDIGRLKKAHPGLITIRPVFAGEQSNSSVKRVDRSNVPIDQLFTEFFTGKNGGVPPREELVKLFMELVNEENREENREESAEV